MQLGQSSANDSRDGILDDYTPFGQTSFVSINNDQDKVLVGNFRLLDEAFQTITTVIALSANASENHRTAFRWRQRDGIGALFGGVAANGTVPGTNGDFNTLTCMPL